MRIALRINFIWLKCVHLYHNFFLLLVITVYRKQWLYSLQALILTPDQNQPDIYEKDIKPNLEAGNVLMFAHGVIKRLPVT